MAAYQYVYVMKNLTKSYPGGREVFKGITLSFLPTAKIGVLGPNGAGKSTLMNIIDGILQPDSGSIRIDGNPIRIDSPAMAQRMGIGFVHQEIALCADISVAENIFMAETAQSRRRLMGGADLIARATEVLAPLADIDPRLPAGRLSISQQQLVEIAKALTLDCRILILDEPTGVLTPAEADHLFRILKGLRDHGKTIILITHKLREIMDTTDNVSVMRRGTMVGTVKTAETSPQALAELMVGRKVLLEVEKRPVAPGRDVLVVENLSVQTDGVARLKGVSLTIRAGEILGIAGVAGNGQSELLQALGGIAQATGRITLNGVDLPLKGRKANGQTRRAAGIAHVPEDRQNLGLIMDFAAWENVGFGYHNAPEYQMNALFMDNAALKADTARKMATFDVRPPIPTLPAKSFSGGNQQKIVVAREIERNPDLLLVGQPTRGVDIGAIEFIHKQIVALRDAGKAVLLVSVELDEIMSLSDRILVMFDGKIMGERDPETTNERDLGLLMAGMTGSEAQGKET